MTEDPPTKPNPEPIRLEPPVSCVEGSMRPPSSSLTVGTNRSSSSEIRRLTRVRLTEQVQYKEIMFHDTCCAAENFEDNLLLKLYVCRELGVCM